MSLGANSDVVKHPALEQPDVGGFCVFSFSPMELKDLIIGKGNRGNDVKK